MIDAYAEFRHCAFRDLGVVLDSFSPQSRRLSRPPAAICAKPASRPRKFRLSRKLAEKNIRLSRRENSGLNTKKSITRVFSILKLITRACFALPRRRCYVFFVFMDKMHLISLHHCRYSKMHPRLTCNVSRECINNGTWWRIG